MSFWNQAFISIPIKIILMLMALALVYYIAKRIPKEVSQKGWAGAIDEIIALGLGLVFIGFVYGTKLSTILAPFLGVLTMLWVNVIMPFLNFIGVM